MADEMTPREAAAELGVTVRTVQRWIADGRLPATRVGSRVRLSRSSLAAVAEGPRPAARRIGAVLIANRGEVAARVARTARAMAIRVIGVHAADDRPPTDAHEHHAIGSYLDADALLAVARRTGADAVHPGYGFLAESASFARAVADAGLAWIGPPADAIAAMGDKAAARRHAARHGVPTIPGYDGAEQDDATLAREAARVGYPLLVKPSAGGGGKGMRVVQDADQLGEALAASRREADRSFGDDRLILERYLAGSRHVEIQVLFDAQGGGVHLGERDCSAQRRNQKILEESPAPSVTPELRERMGEAALRVARSVGYVSAGTVEMLLTDDGEFFFLEMNTRLQVEHPVTEAVTGRDLVADQLRIAQGAALAEIGLAGPPAMRGHAIEARIYAEDPESGFLPATGHLCLVGWPRDVRVDTGVTDEEQVTDRYDPMLAKLIAHGATRHEALDQLRAALDETLILGVRTNVRFLRWLLSEPVVRSGQVRTDTITALDLPAPPRPATEHWQAAASTLERPGDLWSGGWRLNAPPVMRLRHADEERTIAMDFASGSGDDWTWQGPAATFDGDAAYVDVEGQSLEFRIAPPPTVEEALRHAGRAAEGTALLVAPMPGRVIAVRVTAGASVQAHEPIVIIEAMKMEHAVVAPVAGTVSGLSVAVGDQVERGQAIGEVTP